MAVSCIDISHWQGFPNFAKVRAAGVVAMIHKATEGTSFVDPNRATNISNATKAGIKCCTYHWLSPGSDPKKQIAHYIDIVDPVPGERMVIDYEETGCKLDQLKAAVQALLDDPRDFQVTVYSGHLLKEQLGSEHDAFLADNTDLWLAQYTRGTPTWPSNTYATWTLWQYSETGTIDGISGSKVDLNRFDGNDDELVRWISPQSIRPPKPIDPDREVSV
jgi:lysozyme